MPPVPIEKEEAFKCKYIKAIVPLMIKTTFLCHLVSMMREELEGVATQLKGHLCQLSFSRTKDSFFSSIGRDFLTQKKFA